MFIEHLTLQCFIYVWLLNSQNNTTEISTLIILILQKRKMRHREVEEFVQRCIASKW